MAWFEGTVAGITFQNVESGFTVARIRLEPHGTIVAVGVLPPIAAGERLRLSGAFIEHPTYGRQLKVEAAYAVTPLANDEAAVERYLAGGAIQGVGPRLAKRLVQHFGADVLRVIEEAPHRLAEVPGIGAAKATRIARGLEKRRTLRDALILLRSLGLPEGLAARAYRTFGEKTAGIVQADPYRLASDVPGIGFKTADRLAQAAGMALDSPRRIEAAVAHVLGEAAVDGHTYLPPAELTARLEPLGIEADPTSAAAAGGRVTAGIAGLVKRERAVVEATPLGEAVYLRWLWERERFAAERLALLALGCGAPGSPRAADLLGSASGPQPDPGEGGPPLTPLQRQAAAAAASEGVLVVTGGPGTGKTTLIRAVVREALTHGEAVLLAAPTGRAAQRLREATGHEAYTLHRLLEFGRGAPRQSAAGASRADRPRFQRNEKRPLEGDLLVIDEASMIDLPLFADLLRAIPAGMRLVLVGDIDQLPSVGPGAVLADVIGSNRVRVVRLTEVFRQARQSRIVTGAHRINRGEEPECNAPGGDLFFLEAADAAAAAALIRELVTTRLPAYLGLRPGEGVQVLAPMKSGPAGVDELNRLLQEALNPPSPYKAEFRLGERTLRAGDRVMQLRNDYEKDVFNGDIGRITAIDAERRRLEVTFADGSHLDGPANGPAIPYGAEEGDDLALAYAISVHKSQGSEYPAVVIPIVWVMPALMTRNLLYTAVTRARRLAVLVGQPGAFQAYLRGTGAARRFSGLGWRLAATS